MTRLLFLLSTIVVFSATLIPQIKVPTWARDAVWYQIFPERFRNGDPANDPTAEEVRIPTGRDWKVSPWTSDWYRLQPWEREYDTRFYQNVFDRRYGGDLIGVIEKLDYLKDLGVTALYFNPVFEGVSLHKYDASSYHHIDNNFGPDRDGDLRAIERETDNPKSWTWTAADRTFLRLIKEAHARHMRVVIDGVFNHSGTEFWAFQDIMRRQQRSPYADWYDVRRWDDPSTSVSEFDYKGWWDHKALPEFHEDSLGFIHPVREYFFNITKRWMDPNGDGDPSDGIDGWRLDVANEVSSVFWKEWRSLVKTTNPEAIIIGEIWDNAAHWLGGDQFDAVMNYRFAYATVDFFIDREIDAAQFDSVLAAVRADYAPEVNEVLQNLIDSHDTDRLVSMIRNPGRRFDNNNGPRNNPSYDTRRPSTADRQLQRLISLFQMTYVGAPMVYYGTEAGMWGADDPDDRKPMLWDDLTYEAEGTTFDGSPQTPDPVVFDRDLYTWYRSIIHLRTGSDVLRRGSFETVYAAGDVYAFRRTRGNQVALVVLNRGSGASVLLPVTGTWIDALTGERTTSSTSELKVVLPPMSGRVLLKEPAR